MSGESNPSGNPRISELTPPSSEDSDTRRARSQHIRQTSTILNGREPLHIEFLRLGAPAPLPYQPLRYDILPGPHPLNLLWDSALRGRVTEVLSVNGVDPEDVDVVVRRSEFRPWEQGTPTIRVCASKQDTNESWALSIDTIRGYLHTLDMGQVAVEFIDPKVLEDVHPHPIVAGDRIVKAWGEGLSENVTQAVRSINPNAVDVLKVAYMRDNGLGTYGLTDPVVTIGITIGFETKVEECEEPRQRINAALRAHNLKSVVVEFVYGELWPFLSQPDRLQRGHETGSLFDYQGDIGFSRDKLRPIKEKDKDLSHLRLSAYDPKPAMGSSIGPDIRFKDRPAEEHGSGTLGGYLELFDKSTGKSAEKSRGVFALTCWHVLRHAIHVETKQPLGSELDGYDKKGVPVGASVCSKLKVEQPSYVDHSRTQLYLQAQIKVANDKKKPELAQEYRDLQTKMRSIWEKGCKLGQPYAASGFQIDEDKRHRLDWALIKIDSKRINQSDPKNAVGLNKLPPLNTYNFSGPNPRKKDPNWDNAFLTTIGNLSDTVGTQVWTIANQTGLSVGEYSKLRSEVRLNWDNDDQTQSKEHLYFVNPIGNEQTGVVNIKNRGARFGQPGDSGGMVWNENGEWIGIVYAGNPSYHTTYVTPAKTLVAHIEKTLNCTVKLPKLSPGNP